MPVFLIPRSFSKNRVKMFQEMNPNLKIGDYDEPVEVGKGPKTQTKVQSNLRFQRELRKAKSGLKYTFCDEKYYDIINNANHTFLEHSRKELHSDYVPGINCSYEYKIIYSKSNVGAPEMTVKLNIPGKIQYPHCLRSCIHCQDCLDTRNAIHHSFLTKIADGLRYYNVFIWLSVVCLFVTMIGSSFLIIVTTPLPFLSTTALESTERMSGSGSMNYQNKVTAGIICIISSFLAGLFNMVCLVLFITTNQHITPHGSYSYGKGFYLMVLVFFISQITTVYATRTTIYKINVSEPETSRKNGCSFNSKSSTGTMKRFKNSFNGVYANGSRPVKSSNSNTRRSPNYDQAIFSLVPAATNMTSLGIVSPVRTLPKEEYERAITGTLQRPIQPRLSVEERKSTPVKINNERRRRMSSRKRSVESKCENTLKIPSRKVANMSMSSNATQYEVTHIYPVVDDGREKVNLFSSDVGTKL